ncbi:MAG: acyl-CoA thioester hydrolase/BAAT C-terminal domain-containing protein [Planctomycetota bacterium]
MPHLDVTSNLFVGEYQQPEQDHRQTDIVVIVLGGSEGGMPKGWGQWFREMGYPTLTVAYFGVDGLPPRLDRVPVEAVVDAVAWLKGRPELRSARVVVYGGSKGAELALLAASKCPEITGVIVFSPSHVVWQGIPEVFWPPRSSWTWRGEPVPFVPYPWWPIPDLDTPGDLRKMYEQALKQELLVDPALIEVEAIDGPVLVFSGGDDQVWPSQKMAELIVERLDESGFLHAVEHVNYPEAGHAFVPLTERQRALLGGTPEANAAAGEDSRERVRRFLARLEDDSH